MSTTVESPVAVRFARNGLVVDIMNMKAKIPMFDCQFWSDYTEENERFFIGSLQRFSFQSIRHMITGEYYHVFVRAIGILMTMIDGFPYEISAIHSGDVDCLSDLISDYVNDTHSDFIPLYIHTLFANIVQNVNKIHFSVGLMEAHDEAAALAVNRFGYRTLKPLFFVNGMINFSKLFQIFNRDLQTIVIFTVIPNGFIPSIHLLNDLFLEQILCGILEINENIALKYVFEKILIVEAYGIDDFIFANQELFACNGWNLEKTKYEDKKRRGFKSNNVLSIVPLHD